MPDKSLNEVSRELRELYQKGATALERQNLDYAIAILDQLIQKEPGFLDARQALRAAQMKKQGSGGGGFFKKVLGGASASPLMAKGQLALRKNPLEAMQIAEQILAGDPNSSAGNKMLAEAALLAEMPKTACFALEILRRANPKDIEINRRYAQALASSGQVSKADQVYQELLRQFPGDPDLAMEYKNLTAQRTMVEQGYQALEDGTGSYRDILKDKNQAVALEQENRQVKTEDVAQKLLFEYETRLQSEPTNYKLARSIAELLTQQKNFDRALEYYNYIKASPVGNDPSLDKSIADTVTRKFDFQLSQLDASAPEYPEARAKIEAERSEFQIQECKTRAERYPTDLQIKFELGVLYFNAGKITEAIQEFQKAQNNPNRKLASVTYLGRCFMKRGMNDMALRKFQDALKDKVEQDEERKELVYNIGVVLDTMGKKAEAIEQFKQIYESDIGFKDVAARVDAYYAAGGN